MRSVTTLRSVNFPDTQWRLYRAAKPKLIGCSSLADIVLPRHLPGVGRFHAEAWVDERGSWIRDLGTPAGIMINSAPLAPNAVHKIAPGDLLRLGDAVLQVASELQLISP
jgi:pSer/pThr/pTyr-binding forkhead associated (FHA) protein